MVQQRAIPTAPNTFDPTQFNPQEAINSFFPQDLPPASNQTPPSTPLNEGYRDADILDYLATVNIANILATENDPIQNTLPSNQEEPNLQDLEDLPEGFEDFLTEFDPGSPYSPETTESPHSSTA